MANQKDEASPVAKASQKEKDMESPVVEKEKELEITPCQVPVTLFLDGVDVLTQHPQLRHRANQLGNQLQAAARLNMDHDPRDTDCQPVESRKSLRTFP